MHVDPVEKIDSMKKYIKITLFALASILLVFMILHIGWRFKDRQTLNVYILDKTVTQLDRPEHKSLVWALNYNRFVKPNCKAYSNKSDYYGFFPIDIATEAFDFKSIRINEVEEYAEKYDVAYYADCYGVQSFEWYKGKTKPVRSQKVYGGLNQNDYLLLKSMLEKDKLVIGEYNMFSTPTNALVRIKTEELLDINWKGWSGKYFSSLNVNAPDGPPLWMKNLYESQHLGVWPNSKQGIVFLNNDGLIEVLAIDEHLTQGFPVIISSDEAVQRFEVANQIVYENWFEVIEPGGNKVLSHFKLHLTPEGEEKLKRIGISNTFPAIIEGKNNGKMFYFCANFAENPAHMWTSKIAGGKTINHFLTRFGTTNRAKFFKHYYHPLIKNILKEYAEHTDIAE